MLYSIFKALLIALAGVFSLSCIMLIAIAVFYGNPFPSHGGVYDVSSPSLLSPLIFGLLLVLVAKRTKPGDK